MSRGLATGVAAAVSLIPSKLGTETPTSSKTRAEKLFGRGYEVDFTKFTQGFLYRRDYENYTPTEQETENLFEEMSQKDSRLKELVERKFVRGTRYHAVIAEPDENYAKKLEEQTRLSIEHAKHFFDFPELKDISVKFVVPKSAKEVVLNNDPLPVYLVAGLIERKELEFDVKTKQGTSLKVSPRTDKSVVGLSFMNYYLFPGENSPYLSPSDKEGTDKEAVFCSTTAPLEALIQTPIEEILHNSLKTHLHNRFNKQFQGVPAELNEFVAEYNKLREREEKFVHALGILWLEQYNKDRKLGFSEETLRKYFAKQEALDTCYNGMQRLAEHIRKIGLKEARRLYIEAPNKLFEVVEKN